MRILVITHNYPRWPGDRAGNFIARLAAELRDRGHRLRVLAPHAPGSLEHEETDGLLVQRVRYGPERWEIVGYRGDLHRSALRSLPVAAMLPGFLIALRRAARRASSEFRPDVVHAHWWIPGGILATGLRVPLVVTCHGSDVRLLSGGPLRMLGRRVLGNAVRVTTVSNYLADELRGQLPGLRAVPSVTFMPVDVERLVQAKNETTEARRARILFAGNLTRGKGVDVLIRAFARLRSTGTDCELRVVGEGPERERLAQLASRLGVGVGEISWPGVVRHDRMASEYAAATVTVLPSRRASEGLGLTLVESLLAGTAAVGSDAGGIPEVIEHGVTGLLAREGSDEDLAAQLKRLLENPEERVRLARLGQARMIMRHAPAASAENVERILDQAAGADGHTERAPA